MSEDINKLKIEAINLLHENLTEVDSVFNMMFDHFKKTSNISDGNNFESLKDLKNVYEAVIKNVIYRIEKDSIVQSSFFKYIIRKSKINLDVLTRFHSELYGINYNYQLWQSYTDLIDAYVADIEEYLDRLELAQKFEKYKNESEKIINELKVNRNQLAHKLEQVDIIKDDLKNKKVNEIFEDDSKNFKKIARIYEFLFYLVVLIAGLYFLGLTFYVVGFDAKYLSIGFPEKIHGNISAEFYIQKISFLVLSTTLAAFLLKRSFMNRRLADEAYRTAKELDALPRYMEGMPDEMKEKIRFDLAYKYFGNGIHHDSYTGGENLMHENIKANTEFVKVVKGVPSTTGESKADKDKNE